MYNLTDLKKKGFEKKFVFTVNRDMEYSIPVLINLKRKNVLAIHFF